MGARAGLRGLELPVRDLQGQGLDLVFGDRRPADELDAPDEGADAPLRWRRGQDRPVLGRALRGLGRVLALQGAPEGPGAGPRGDQDGGGWLRPRSLGTTLPARELAACLAVPDLRLFRFVRLHTRLLGGEATRPPRASCWTGLDRMRHTPPLYCP